MKILFLESIWINKNHKRNITVSKKEGLVALINLFYNNIFRIAYISKVYLVEITELPYHLHEEFNRYNKTECARKHDQAILQVRSAKINSEDDIALISNFSSKQGQRSAYCQCNLP